MNDTTEKNSSLKKYRKYRWTFIGLLIFIVFVEWYAKSSFDKSFESLDAAMSQLQNGKELPFKQFQSMKQGFPSKTVDESGLTLRKVHFVWSGVFKNHHLRFLVDENDNIVTYDTEAEGNVAGMYVITKKGVESHVKKAKKESDIIHHRIGYYTKMEPTLPLEIPMIAEKKAADSKNTEVNEESENAKLEPVSDTHLQIEGLIKKHTFTPLNGKNKTVLQKEVNKKWEQWHFDRYLGSYKKYGNRDPKWDEQAITFIQYCCKLTVKGSLKKEDAPALIKKADFIERSGCDDPMVRYFYLLARSKMAQHSERKKLEQEALESVLYKFQDSKYPLEIQLVGSILVRDVAQIQPHQWSTPTYRISVRSNNNRASVDYHWKASQHLVAALKGQKLNHLGRRFYLRFVLTHFMLRNSKLFRLTVVTMEQNKDIDPWLTMMLKGRFYFHLAVDLEAMNANYWIERSMAHKSMTYLQNFQQAQAIVARDCFEKAWMIDPTLPQAPRWVMLTFGRTGDITTIERSRFWFDQAIQAQFDFEPVYKTYIEILGFPFFKDRKKQLADFAEECLNTNRFDTAIPGKYYSIIHSLNSHVDPSILLRQPSIYQNLEKMFSGYNSMPETSKQEVNAGKSFIAYMHWLNGNKDKAKDLIDELGSDFSGSLLIHFRIDSSEFLREFSSSKTPSSPKTAVKSNSTATDVAHAICFINAGKQCLTGNNTGKVIVWDVETQKKLDEFSDHSRPITSITYSKDRKMIATSSLDGNVILRNVEDFAIVKKIGDYPSVLHARFSPNGAILAISIVSHDLDKSGIQLWDTKTFEKIGTLNQSGDHVASLAWSPDGNTLAATPVFFVNNKFGGKDIVFWDLESKKTKAESLNYFTENNGVCWSPDGKYLAVYGADHIDNIVIRWKVPKIHILDAASHRILHTLKSSTGKFSDVAFTSDSNYILGVGLENSLIMWNLKTGKRENTVMDSVGRLSSIEISRDTQDVAYIGSNGLLQTRTLEEIKNYQFQPKSLLKNKFRAIRQMQLSSQGEILAVGDHIDGVRLWNTKTGKPIALWFPVVKGYFMNHFDISKNGKYLAIACGDKEHTSGAVVVYDFDTGKLLFEYPFNWHGAMCVQFSKDEKTLFSNGPENDVMAWDTSTGKVRLWEMLYSHETQVTSMVVSPDGKYLYTSSPSGVSKDKQRIEHRLNRWEIPQDKLNEKYALEPLDYNHKQFEFTGAGKLLISPDGTHLIGDRHRFDLSEMKQVAPNAGRPLAVSPVNDQYALYGAHYNLAKGTQSSAIIISPFKDDSIASFKLSHDVMNFINSAVFSSDGKKLYAARKAKRIIVWDLDSRRPLLELK